MHPAVIAVVHHSQFWPTVGRVFSAIGAAGAGVATIYARLSKQTAQRVEVKVNGQLHRRIDELADAADKLKSVTQERDELVLVAKNASTVTPADTEKHSG